MEFLERLLELLFGRREKAKEVGVAEAREIVLRELESGDAALADFASKKFAEIRYLVASLSKNAEELLSQEIKVDEGNKSYRQIISTSQKNLGRHLKGISNKITPPTRVDAGSVREYAPVALKSVSMDLMPYWKNIALARLMLRDEVKAIGSSLQELSEVLGELNRASFSERRVALLELRKSFSEMDKKEAETGEVQRTVSSLSSLLHEKKAEVSELQKRLAAKELSPEYKRLAGLQSELAGLEKAKEVVISRFNSEIAPLEKVLKRLAQFSESSAALSQNEKELLHMLLNSPFSAFVSDPNGAICKGLLMKAEGLIEGGSISLKDSEKEKKLAAIKALLGKDFFTDYFWETNKIQAEMLRVQKQASSLGISSEVDSMKSSIESVKDGVKRLEAELSKAGSGKAAAELESMYSSSSELFNRTFEKKYVLVK